MKKIRFVIASLLVAVGIIGFSVYGGASVSAFDPTAAGCRADPSAAICQSNAGNVNTFAQNLVRLLLWAIGVISVIMIIVGGIFYTLSGGDASKIKRAKDTVLYSVIGLVVALLAYAIVNFVLNWF